MAAKKIKGKTSGLKGDGKPNAYWRRFKERLDSYDQIPISDWKEENFLGHIMKKYKDQMQIDFALSYSGPPTKCKEIFCIRKMLLSLGTEDPNIVKQYIDWVFDTVIIPQKTTISSVAYFFTTTLILKFKQEMRKINKITRATKIPDNYKDIVNSLDLDVSTYGDLAFAKVAIADNPSDFEEYSKLFVELEKIGFNENILKTL